LYLWTLGFTPINLNMKMKINSQSIKHLTQEFSIEKSGDKNSYELTGYHEFLENFHGEFLIQLNFNYDYINDLYDVNIDEILEATRSSMKSLTRVILNSTDRVEFLNGGRRAEERILEILIFTYGVNSSKSAA